MMIFEEPEQIKDIPATAIALGNFDGVHPGHKKLIEAAVEAAEKKGLKPAVFTFSNHPRDLIPGAAKVESIITTAEKEKILEDMGIEYLFSIPFTKEIMNLSPEDFVYKLLIEKFNMKVAISGFDYRFGHYAKGNTETMKELGKRWDFDVIEIPAEKIDGQVISSTIIRKAIAEGDMQTASKFLGRNFTVEGTVTRGNRVGSGIGFPTANISVPEGCIMPPNGVYLSVAYIDGKEHKAITNIGNKPTIGKYRKNIETHVFDLNEELYGENICVEFLKMMRDEKKFDNVKELKNQIASDCRDAEELHKRSK